MTMRKISVYVALVAFILCCVAAQAQLPSSAAAQAGNNAETNISLVAGPIPQRVHDTTARIWWQTSGPSSTILMYGTDPNNLSQKKEEAWGQQSHSVELSGLQPGTTYYYQVVTSDGRTLDKGTFQTESAQQKEQQFQITHGPVIEQVGPDSIVVAWTTNQPSSSVVMYGTDPNNLGQRAEAQWGQQTHRVTVRSLKPSTRYYFQVQTGQAQGSGQSLTSAVFSASTEAAGQQAKTFNTK
jgi:phosphodiesterase/alkaline phosphatase D-like protein